MGEHLASRADVSRLFGRAAFGARPGDLEQWSGRPYAEAVDHLLAVPQGGTAPGERTLTELASVEDIGPAQRWWLNRMVSTPYPLEERMTLLWHDHFATAHGRVRGHELLEQNQTIRANALGNFRSLVSAMTVDAAMLKWLDGTSNIAGDANENYAREFLELFTLGTMPQVYNEADVREAARAFTGWEAADSGLNPRGHFRPQRHDTGTKAVLGQTIPNLDAEEHRRVADIALAQPVAPRFVAYKLVRHLAYEPQTHDLVSAPDPLVEEVASALIASDWDLRTAVRALLMSDHFRYGDATSGQQRVRYPVEIAVHALKAHGIPRGDDPYLVSLLRDAGQAPFEPPNVSGWPAGEHWLTEGSYLGLYGITHRALRMRGENPLLGRPRAMPDAADIAAGGAAWAATMGLHALSSTTLSTVQDHVASGLGGNESDLQEGIFLLIANSPDWQVM